MTARHQLDVLTKRQEIVLPPAQRSCEDHSFGLPTVIYWASAAFLFGFVGTMSLVFAHRELIVPMVVIVFFLAMFFAIPTLFVRIAPKDTRQSLSWSQLMEAGIDTATGRTSGRETAVLVLMLPFLILCWGFAIVVIATLA